MSFVKIEPLSTQDNLLIKKDPTRHSYVGFYITLPNKKRYHTIRYYGLLFILAFTFLIGEGK